ncbi:hypothetical protein M3175_12085 [Robertmurraya korlensis]|jgi:hypothetical protein|uniref:hypothetical protein n=1 Tax=Robertmurraya TaxID=2837507 RepID=UPI000E6AFB8C|nr:MULTISPECIES: hypothetical protein [Bacillaceae]AYA76640.1 hypothetical protein DOE78_14980 [Bacillus sp. Y1]MCM3601475.1 hypothetical protein [Robertmurraya korlensis]
MNEMQRRALGPISTIAKFGLVLGALLFLYSFFESGITMSYTLSISISIMASSMLVFGFGLFISLMGEVRK